MFFDHLLVLCLGFRCTLCLNDAPPLFLLFTFYLPTISISNIFPQLSPNFVNSPTKHPMLMVFSQGFPMGGGLARPWSFSSYFSRTRDEFYEFYYSVTSVKLMTSVRMMM